MTPQDNSAGKGIAWKPLLFKFGTGMLVGVVGAMGMIALFESGMLGPLGPSREIAALVGLLYLLTAALVGFGLVAPGAGAKLLNVEDAEEIGEMRPMLIWSCVGTLALAVMLIVAALSGPGAPIAAGVGLIATIALFTLAWFASLRSRSHTDELMQAVSKESAGLAFYLAVVIGGGWSLLVHLGFAERALAPLDWLTLFSALLLLASFIVVFRRGMVREL